MDINNAREAGVTASQIDGLNKIIGSLQTAIDGGYALAGQVAVNTPTASNVGMSFPAMDVSESAGIFAAAKDVYQARLDTLITALAAL